MPLTDDELAYMREVQAEHRPTAATLTRQGKVSDGMGGWTTDAGVPQPIQVRVANTEKIPDPWRTATGRTCSRSRWTW